MINYLSFGGGVNSVALYLLMMDQGQEFEAVFVDHGTDWPETYEYVDMFKREYSLTVLKPDPAKNQGVESLYDYYYNYRTIPYRMQRSCSERFKIAVMRDYCQTPCFMNIGFDAGEEKRAKIINEKGFEHRYPLIEEGLDRKGCIELIESHGLPVPMKSGCYVCPFQRIVQWKELRRKHPDLFCKAQQLEEQSKSPYTLHDKGPLRDIVEENQEVLFEELEYPPCHCMR